MKKIGIYVCGNVSKRCTANGCLRAFNDREDSFSNYSESDSKLVSFNNCNGCDGDPMESLLIKIEKFEKAGVDTIHLSSCIRGKCDHYQEFADELSKHFDVIGYTHGSAEGKKNNNINKKRVTFTDFNREGK
ncbi:CGGC domain-containing protein [Tissierella sp. Yu-01]|uniref:CGGC domain-containing protein n=1 Tax=Tissierella sp. Yu-01 TaxID=3035694 RepID=UPI00240D1712|nr:CGGC domain-containing protein [Tissierella sp. Yu-01]WFA10271.1 CGGC domain-containing protein [Tissierella sp. Yu-01]